ncbi:hypothetical protein F5X99DRAFT_428702 [Biscogniauxia marginata]|nr:hypothetical protein F5X99DRAFT_428702 [Biscogniauxia marginata]
MPYSRHASTGSGRSAYSATSRISKTSNVSRSTSTSTSSGGSSSSSSSRSSSSNARAGTSGGVLSRMLSSLQKKNHHGGRRKDNGDNDGDSSDRTAKYPRLGAIDEDKENWIASYQVTHYPDRPRVDKRTRPELRKKEDEYRDEIIQMQERNMERRIQNAATAALSSATAESMAAVAARRNLTTTTTTAAAADAATTNSATMPSIRTDIDIDLAVPNFSYSSCSPKGSRENLSSWSASASASESPVFRWTEWQQQQQLPGPHGASDDRWAAAPTRERAGTAGRDERALSDSLVSPGTGTIKIALYPGSIYWRSSRSSMPASAGEDDSARPLSLAHPFTFPVDGTAARRLGLGLNSGDEYDSADVADDDADSNGGEAAAVAAAAATRRPASHNRREDKTRRSRRGRNSNSVSDTQGGSHPTQARATRARHKRARGPDSSSSSSSSSSSTRDSPRTSSYIDTHVRDAFSTPSPPRTPSLVSNNNNNSSSPDSERAGGNITSPPTPASRDTNPRRNKSSGSGSSSSSGYSDRNRNSSPILFFGSRAQRSDDAHQPKLCPMPGCHAPLTGAGDLKHNLCSSCRRELQPRESTFYGDHASSRDGSDLEMLPHRHHPAVVEEAKYRTFKAVKSSKPTISRGNSDSAAMAVVEETETGRIAAANQGGSSSNLSSRFNNGAGAEFKLEPAPPGRARSKKTATAQHTTRATTLRVFPPPSRGDSASVPPPPSHRPPPPPLRLSASSSSLLPSAASKSSSGSNHISFQLSRWPSSSFPPSPSPSPSQSPSPSPTPAALGPGLLLEARTFKPPSPSPHPRRPSPSPQSRQQPGSPTQISAAPSTSSASNPRTHNHNNNDNNNDNTPSRRPQLQQRGDTDSTSPFLTPHTASISPPRNNNHLHPHHHSHDARLAPPITSTSTSTSDNNTAAARVSAAAVSEDDLYHEIASIIDCYVRAEHMSEWEHERRKASAVAAYFAEDPEEVEMRRRGFF